MTVLEVSWDAAREVPGMDIPMITSAAMTLGCLLDGPLMSALDPPCNWESCVHPSGYDNDCAGDLECTKREAQVMKPTFVALTVMFPFYGLRLYALN